MRPRALAVSTLVALAGLVIGPHPGAWAQKVPIGSEFQVTSYTTGNQGGFSYNTFGACGYRDGRHQAVGSDADGNFIVVWTDGDRADYGPDGQDGSAGGIFAQRFDSSGQRLGGEFQVNTYTTGDQRYPRVAVDSAGNFVVVWTGQDSYYFGYPGTFYDNIRGRRFDSAGTAQGAEFEINSATDPDLYSGGKYPAVAFDGGGRFVVVWEEIESADYREIHGRRFDSAGGSLGSEFTVSEVGGYAVEAPDVVAHANGSFAVVWHESYAIQGRRFDSTGGALGGQFEIQPQGFFETFPRAAPDGSGGFVVVWTSSTLDDIGDDFTDIGARRYDSAGAALGSAFRVNTYTTSWQHCPAIAAAPDGRFVVTWTRGDEYDQGAGQQFDASGTPVGPEFLVNTSASQHHVGKATSVAMNADGDFVVVWSDIGIGGGVDGDGLGVFGQRFGDATGFACSPAPLAGCREQTVEKRGAFRFKESANPNSRNLAWQWLKGEATSSAEFGNPLTSTSYAFCVYDSSPLSSQPLISTTVPPGGTCGSIACWRQLSGAGPPLMYLDPDRDLGGIAQIHLKPGVTDGAARVLVKARGAALALPPTPLEPPVTVQLQGSHGECFTSTYDAFVAKNADGQFRAKPETPPQPTSSTTTTTSTTSTSTTTTTMPPVCGDAILVPAFEQCDDGNTADGDGCSSGCLCNPATTPAVCSLTGDWETPTLSVAITESGGFSTLSGISQGVPFTGSLTRTDSCATGTLTVLGFNYVIRATVADDCNAFTGVVPALGMVMDFVRVL